MNFIFGVIFGVGIGICIEYTIYSNALKKSLKIDLEEMYRRFNNENN